MSCEHILVMEWRPLHLAAEKENDELLAEVASLRSENESLKAALRESCGIAEEYIAHRRTTAVLLASDHTANSIKSACADDAARLASLRQKADSK